jgi:hypothetical protein
MCPRTTPTKGATEIILRNSLYGRGASKGVLRKKSSDRRKEAPRIKLMTAAQLVLFSICTAGAISVASGRSIRGEPLQDILKY